MSFKKKALKFVRKSAAFLRWQMRGAFSKRSDCSLSGQILAGLERDSFFVVKNFMTVDEAGALKNDIANYRAVHQEKLTADRRIGHLHHSIDKMRWTMVDRYVPGAKAYATHPLILDVAKKFHGRTAEIEKCTYEEKRPGTNPESGPLAGREEATIFFHSDRPFGVLKTILLLSDVEKKDGPFLIVRGSHKLGYKAPVKRLFKMMRQILGDEYSSAMTVDEEKKYFNSEDVVACTGQAGDLYFVTTMAYHKGPPLEAGGYRAVLWNYCYNESLFNRVPQEKK